MSEREKTSHSVNVHIGTDCKADTSHGSFATVDCERVVIFFNNVEQCVSMLQAVREAKRHLGG